ANLPAWIEVLQHGAVERELPYIRSRCILGLARRRPIGLVIRDEEARVRDGEPIDLTGNQQRRARCTGDPAANWDFCAGPGREERGKARLAKHCKYLREQTVALHVVPARSRTIDIPA